MNEIVAAGTVMVPSESANSLESLIESEAKLAGFPSGEEFKWSPPRDSWMRRNLVGQDRENFFCKVIEHAQNASCMAILAIVDISARSSTGQLEPGLDAIVLLLERIHESSRQSQGRTVLVFDRPSGGSPKHEGEFVKKCKQVLASGTKYSTLEAVDNSPFVEDSSHHRLLQLADLVTSCTAARVAGEEIYSVPIFQSIRPLLRERDGICGGRGLKIHPDFNYQNLYHWILGDTHLGSRGSGTALPNPGRPYPCSPTVYA